MADWGQRAKDRDRDDAIKVIEDAAARGRIVDVDKQKRIQDVRAAETVAEIDLITRGLAAAPDAPSHSSSPAEPATPSFQTYTPPTSQPVIEPDPTPPTTVQYGEPLTPSAGTPIATPPMIRKSGHGGKLMLIVVLVVLAGIAVPVFIGINALVDTVQDGIEEIDEIGGIDGIGGGADVDMFSQEGLDDLAAALEEETGSTMVFSATLYPEYAVLEVPAERSGPRMLRYYWNGDLEQQSKGQASYPKRMDLRDIDADVVTKLIGRINTKVEDATSNYISAHAPSEHDKGAFLWGYASNDFSEGGYVAATLDGKVVLTTTW